MAFSLDLWENLLPRLGWRGVRADSGFGLAEPLGVVPQYI